MNIREIQTKILFKKTKQDKNGKDYLILELESGESIFVFANAKLSANKWSELNEGEEYTFMVKEGVNGSNILVDFEIEFRDNYLVIDSSCWN